MIGFPSRCSAARLAAVERLLLVRLNQRSVHVQRCTGMPSMALHEAHHLCVDPLQTIQSFCPRGYERPVRLTLSLLLFVVA